MDNEQKPPGYDTGEVPPVGRTSPYGRAGGDYPPPYGPPTLPRSSGKVRYVKPIAITMIVYGSLNAFSGLFVILMGAFFLLMSLVGPATNRAEDVAGPIIMGVVYLLMGVFIIGSGITIIIAGIKNLKFRSRILGIVALCLCGAGALSCSCISPLAVTILVLGLIVYTDQEVRSAFEMGDQGADPDVIISKFNTPPGGIKPLSVDMTSP